MFFGSILKVRLFFTNIYIYIIISTLIRNKKGKHVREIRESGNIKNRKKGKAHVIFC